MSYPSNISYWEIKQYLQDVDLLVVGSGIVGLTTAIFYKRRFPKKKVLIVERGTLPSGASTKNAGFACFGSPSEILSDLKTCSENDVYQIVEQRITGLSELRSLVGDANMSYEPCGGYEVFRKKDETLFQKCLDFIPIANKKLLSRSGLKETYTVADNKIAELGLENVTHLIKNNHEGALDTGKMMNCLLKFATNSDITILNGLEVSDFANHGSSVKVSFKNGFTIWCKNLHVATNGFAHKLLPNLDVKPARAQVLITSPIENLKIEGTFHMDEGYYYFRNVGDRVLFGGGRQLDMDNETSTNVETTALIQNTLDELLRTVIVSNDEYKIEHRWAGIMGVGQTKQTIVKRISEGVTCSVRLGGMGVAIGTSIGKRSAEIIG